MIKKPNILYLHSHDTGIYIQPYGFSVPTPNLQHLAEEGVLFRKAFSASAACCPSRAALLTGQSPHNAGMTGQITRGWKLNDYSQHIIHQLKKDGYHTCLAGIQHIAPDSNMIGYDTVVSTASMNVADVVPKVRNYFETLAKINEEKPFFFSVGFKETHRPYHQKSWKEDARYSRPPLPLPDTPKIRDDMSNFAASARVMDTGMGEIIQLLDEYNMTENTLVICTTDHGIAFPSMKINLTDAGTQVFMIMRGPDGFSGGKVVNGLVSQIDIFPTLCEYLNINKPDWLQGKSILPLIHNEVEEINDAIFHELNYHASYEPKRAVRTQRWKYICRFDTNPTVNLSNVDDSISKDVWIEHSWNSHFVEGERLFDLMFDPNEKKNLAADPKYGCVLNEMRNRLNNWMESTNDPLLKGKILPPKGVKLNRFGQTSPHDERFTVE